MTASTKLESADAPDGAPPDKTARHAVRIPFLDKLLYGIGQYGEGLQSSAAISLLLFFYSQVLGLNAAVVGAGLMLTGILNGVVDAFIGSWSDVTRSKWGRRHPYLYFSPIPAAVSMVLLFCPLAVLVPWALSVWLFFWYTILRTAMSVYLVPHWALGAEMSQDYHERTKIVSWRTFFSFLGGGSFFIVSLVFFNTKDKSSNALLHRTPYLYVALLIGLVAIVTELGSAFGTRSYIPRLPKRPSDAKTLTPAIMWRELHGLFTNKAFIVFFSGTMILSLTLSGKALDVYMGVYFWRLPADLTLILPGLSTVAYASGTFFWAFASNRLGKKRTYITGVVMYGTIMALLPILKVCGIFFADGSVFYFPTILTVSMLGSLSFAACGVMAGALLPDVVDDYFRQTGRRMAGIVAGLLVLIASFSAAASQLIAGLTLNVIGLAPKASPDSVPADISNQLGLASGIISGGLSLIFAVVFRAYPIKDRR